MQAAVETARQTGQKVREWLWNAREAERTLGRMISEARTAGDLSVQGAHVVGDDMSSLADLGVSRDLAAYAVAVAKVPDEVWLAGRCRTAAGPGNWRRRG
jgi:hypothetical protein